MARPRRYHDQALCCMAATVLAMLVSACAVSPSVAPSSQSSVGKNPSVAASPPNEDPSERAVGGAAEEQAATLVELGSGSPISMPPSRPAISLDGDAVMLNFEQAPLVEVVHSILGETLGLDYIIENNVPGNVTVRTRSPIPRDQLLPILESLLRSNNVLMIRGPNDRFFVSGSPVVRAAVPSFESSPTEGFSNVIVPLQYISAMEMADILKPVAREDTFVRIDQSRNLLILAGTQLQLEGWLSIVATFDVDQLEGMSVGIFPLENSEVADVLEELEHLVNGNSGATGAAAAGIAAMVNIMPVMRLNSVMVVSPQAEYVQMVGEWVSKLDGALVQALEPSLHVYPVKNASATQLASLLSTIFGGGGGEGSPSRGGVAPGMTEKNASSSSGASQPNERMQGTASFSLENDVRVVADSYNNSLLVYATPFEYEKIARTLKKLDVVSTQVLIEASIVEVSLGGDLQYGLEWAFDNDLGGGDTGSGLLDLGAGLQPKSGFSYTFTNNASSFKAVINALAQKSLINVISTPSVLVLDNHTASIQVGDQQPIQNSQVITDGGNISSSISYKDTGVQLTVTPSVNDGGLVTLEIEQSVTDVGQIDAATGQRTFLNRDVRSKVAVRDGESVVLGGLIRDNETSGKSGVQILMVIPVLGSLFSTTTEQNNRTELLVFITPRVMESDEDLRALNSEMRSRMSGIKDFEDLPASFQGTNEKGEGAQ